MINLRQLECLRAVITTGSMTQAAKSLGIAQPSASSLISNLEHTLGFLLFERIKGRLVATPEAKLLMTDVTRTLESVELTSHKARQIRENRIGDLRIVSYPDIAIDFLPMVLTNFLKVRPGVRVNLQARRSEMMSGLLSSHDYDLAISTHLKDSKNLEATEVTLPCVAAFPRGFGPDNKSVEVPDLTKSVLISVSSNHPTSIQLAERFSQSGLPYPSSTIETQTFESACGFIRRGYGCGLIDSITAARYAHELDLRSFSPAVWQTIYLLRPLDQPASKLQADFKAVLQEELEALAEKYT